MKYEELYEKMKNCRACTLRNRIFLPGDGNLSARVMCVGIAPSKWRTHNETFGMKSKTYFEKFLEILGLRRSDTWNSNVVKCIDYGRGTGDPAKCVYYLLQEIEIIDPRYVILFGRDTAKWVLGSELIKDGGMVIKDGRKYFTSPHPMIAVYHGAEGEARLYSVAKKIRDYMRVATLEDYL